MSITIRGHFDGRAIVPDEPLDLPADQQVEIEVRLVPKPRSRRRGGRRRPSITSLPFFGMWADRVDMRDSAEWVRKEREGWNKRLTRQP